MAMHTPRLLIHIVGLKIEVLAAAQLCSKGGERRNVGMGLFPHHSVFSPGWRPAARWKCACQHHPQRGFLHAPTEEWEEMLVRGAAV